MRLLSKSICALVVALALAGCFSGTKSSYPHVEEKRVMPLAAGNYNIENLKDKKVSNIRVSKNSDKTYTVIDGNKRKEVGFYYNSRTTYLMYQTGEGKKSYEYFLVQPTAGHKGLIVYDATKAAAKLLNDMVGSKVSSVLSTVPFTGKSYNKYFFEKLGEVPTKSFERAYIVRSLNG